MEQGVKEGWVQSFKFLLFSISAGVIQIGTFTLMFEVFGWAEWICYIISLTLSVLYNFTLNREFTFKSAKNVPLAMGLVACFYLAFAPLSTWWVDALTKIGWNGYLVEALTMVVNFIGEFLYCKFVVYRNSINTNKRALKNESDANKSKQSANASTKESDAKI